MDTSGSACSAEETKGEGVSSATQAGPFLLRAAASQLPPVFLTQFGEEPVKMEIRGGNCLWEIPLSVRRFGPFRIPFGGGGYLRLYPLFITKALFRRHEREGKSVILYVHPWELDSDQPKIDAPFGVRARISFGIDSMEHKLRRLLMEMEFVSLEKFLDSRQ